MAAIWVGGDLLQSFPKSFALGPGHARQFLLGFRAEVQRHAHSSPLIATTVKQNSAAKIPLARSQDKTKIPPNRHRPLFRTPNLSHAAAAQIDLSTRFAPLLAPIISAVADRAEQTQEAFEVEATATEDLILSFQPVDAAEAMLAGQMVAFHALIADSTRQVLHGLNDVLKTRRIAGILSLGRLTQGHLDRVKKRGNQPHQAKIDVPEAAGNDAPDATAARVKSPKQITREAPSAEPPQHPLAATSAKGASQPAPHPEPQPEPRPTLRSEPEPATDPAPDPRPEEPVYTRPVRPESWIDEPYQEWLVETPADLLLRRATTLVAEFEKTANRPPPTIASPDPDPANTPAETEMGAAAAGD
jgi:hypothetical protein